MIDAMIAKAEARQARLESVEPKLARIDRATGQLRITPFARFAESLTAGDLLVVNDSATIPASLRGRTGEGAAIEVRLASFQGEDLSVPRRWKAIAFGGGDWRTPTEERPGPPLLAGGARIHFGEDLTARVERVFGRVLELELEGDAAGLWRALYRAGRPIQYAYHREPLAIWDQQTIFASVPVSVEPPSAAFPLRWDDVFRARSRGARIARLTHAAGLSSIGPPELERLLPFDERYWIPAETAEAVSETRRNGGRVIAIGTTVTRALEDSAAADGEVRAGTAVASIRLSGAHRLRAVSGMLTGMHEPGSSHLSLLDAFIPREVLDRATATMKAEGFVWHEYGDSCLVL